MTRTGTDPKIQVRVRVHAKVPVGFLLFRFACLSLGLGPTRDPIGYPKYPKLIVYIRYIWVIGYIFDISDIFF